MTAEVYELQQQVVAAESRTAGMEDTAQRVRDELTAGRAAAEAERHKWEARVADLQAEHEACMAQLRQECEGQVRSGLHAHNDWQINVTNMVSCVLAHFRPSAMFCIVAECAMSWKDKSSNIQQAMTGRQSA